MLSSRYGVGDRADIDKEELVSEWMGLKQIISQSYRHMSAKPICQTPLNRQYHAYYVS